MVAVSERLRERDSITFSSEADEKKLRFTICFHRIFRDILCVSLREESLERRARPKALHKRRVKRAGAFAVRTRLPELEKSASLVHNHKGKAGLLLAGVNLFRTWESHGRLASRHVACKCALLERRANTKIKLLEFMT